MSHANLSPILSRRLHRAAPRRQQRGFSLLEALVSIVVLSFGLLGVAGLQASSLKYSRDARNQTVAVNLARELAEMIRSNARESGKTADNPYLMVAQDINSDGNKPPSTCLDVGKDCGDDANQLAEDQVKDWAWRVGKALPSAHAAVCLDDEPYDAKGLPQWECTPRGSNIIAIKIGWQRDDFERDAENKLVTKKANEMRPFVVLPVTPAGQQ